MYICSAILINLKLHKLLFPDNTTNYNLNLNVAELLLYKYEYFHNTIDCFIILSAIFNLT